MKIYWLLRGRAWRQFHVHRCLDCKRRFCDDEPGSWTDNRSNEYPELCRAYSCQGRSHRGGCGHGGPFCLHLCGQGR